MDKSREKDITMIQDDLWHESLEDALRSIVEATGGPKRVAADLWPAKRIADAARQLNHCLDPERPEKLSLDELQLIAKRGSQAGVHTFMTYLARELGYDDPRPVAPEDERAQLQREFQASVKLQQKIMQRMERLAQTPANIKAVG